jgi:hypothetical protein
MSDMRRLIESMDSISQAATKPTGPKFPGYWQGRDSAAKSRDRMVGDESIIPSLAKQAKEKTLEWQIEEAYQKFKEQDAEVKVGGSITQNNPTTTELTPLAPAAASGSNISGMFKPGLPTWQNSPLNPANRRDSTSAPAVAPFGSGPPDTSLLKMPSQGSSAPAVAPTIPAVKPAVTAAPVPYKGSAGSQEIQKLNPAIKDVNKIQPGQRFKMPNGQPDYIVKPGDTLDKIARGSNKPAGQGFDVPKAAPAAPAAKPAAPAAKPAAPPNKSSDAKRLGVPEKNIGPSVVDKISPAAPATKPGVATPGPTPRKNYDQLTPQEKQTVDAIDEIGKQARAQRERDVKAAREKADRELNKPRTEAINKLAEQFAAFMEAQDEYGPEYQAMVQRVGQRARQGAMKTVWDPVKRVYKNVPVKQTKSVKEYENAQDQDSQVTSQPSPAATASSQTFVQDKELQNMNAQKTLEADAGAQDPNKQTTSPPSPAAVAKPVAPSAPDVSVATAKTTMAGLKPALGPNVDTNAAATGVTKANLGQQLNPAEQQAVSALTPLVMKAATIPSAAPQLRSALTNAGTIARATAAKQGKM